MAVGPCLKKMFFAPFTRLVIGIVVVFGLYILVDNIGWQLFDEDLANNWAKISTLCLASAAGVAGYIFLYRFYEKRRITELGFKGFGKQAVIGTALGVGVVAVVVMVLALTGSYTITALNRSENLLIALILSLCVGLFEEVLSRGVLFRLCEKMTGTIGAICISSVVFGAVHITNEGMNLTGCINIAVTAGVMFSAAYVITRSLWLPIFIHAAWNFTMGGIFGATVSGTDYPGWLISEIEGPQWLTGGTVGPEGSVVLTVLGIAVSIVMLRIAARRGQIISFKNRKLLNP